MLKKPYFLITTADERVWREEERVLFLGEWCIWHGKNTYWDGVDTEVMPAYGWEEGQRQKDCAYIDNLTEDLLYELTEALNSFHRIDRPLRSWRIMLGTWLYKFITIAFNRWMTIQYAVEHYNISGTVVLDIPKERLVPLDYNGFVQLSRLGDWDHAIYARILKDWFSINCDVVAVDNGIDYIKRRYVPPPTQTFKTRLKYVFSHLAKNLTGVLSRDDDAFLLTTYLPLKEECRLQFLLGQFPVPWISPPTPAVQPHVNVRNTFRISSAGYSGFEEFIRIMISEQIPVCYLEGYNELCRAVDHLPWPRRPKLIFTSNRFDSDEVFKAWVANKTEASVPYIIGQHGANYGTSEYSPSERHEIATADCYLTWGWSENNEKHYPAAALTVLGQRAGRWNSKGGILLVERGGGNREQPWDEVPAIREYFDDQISFVKLLDRMAQDHLTVRLLSNHNCLDWSEEIMWKERSPETTIDSGRQPIANLIPNSRLIIYSYNSAGIHESLALNVPTLFFWNLRYWPLRKSVLPVFNQLEEVGIFHRTPESAAKKVNQIYKDVGGWWWQDDVQEARQLFSKYFARMPDNPTNVLKNALLNCVNKTEYQR